MSEFKNNDKNGTGMKTKILYFMLFVCASPSLLNLLGFDFGSDIIHMNDSILVEGQVNTPHLFQVISGTIHHTLFEWSAVIFAFLTVFVTFLHYHHYKNVTVPIIGMALFSAGAMDAFHSLAATRIIESNSPDTSFIPLSWALSRVFNGFIMLFAAVFSLWLTNRNLKKTFTQESQHKLLIITGVIFFLLSFIVMYVTLTSDNLPQTMFPEALITRPYDILPLALFICSGVFYWLWYKKYKTALQLSLVLSIIPEIATQIHMAFGSVVLFDNHFNIGHFLKNIAYFTIFIGVLMDFSHKTKKANESKKEVFNSQLSHQKVKPPLNHQVNIGKVSRPLVIKIPLVGFIFSLFISMSIATIFYIESYQLIRDKGMNELSLQAKIVTPLTKDLFYQSASDIKFLAKTQPVGNMVESIEGISMANTLWKNRLNAIFIEFLKHKPHYKKISLISTLASNDVVVSAKKVNGDVLKLEGDALQKDITFTLLSNILNSSEDEAYFSKVTKASDENSVTKSSTSFFVGIPIFDLSKEKVVAVIAIEVDLTSYFISLKDGALAKVSFYMSNDRGEPLFHSQHVKIVETASLSNRKNSIKNNFSHLSTLSDTDLDVKQIFNMNTNVENHTFAFYSKIRFDQKHQIPPLNMLIENNNDEFIVAVNNMKYRAILLSLSLSFICLAISIFFARKITRPLSKMSQGLLSYEQTGAFGELPIKEKDEIGLLARSFHNALLTIDDKTEQLTVTANKAQKASLELQAILDSIVDAVISIDDSGHILAFNKAATKMFGYSEEEVLHKNINILMPISIANKHDGYIKSFQETGISKIIGVGRELSAMRKDGEIFSMHLSINEVNTDEGVLYTGLIRDITALKLLDAENKRVYQQAKEVAWRLNFALSAPQIGVWERDISSGRLYWDEQIYTLFGYEGKNHINPKDIWKQVLHPDDAKKTNEDILNIIETGQRLKYQHRIILPNGDVRHIEGHAQLLNDEKNNKIKIVGTSRDNTEQIKVEEIKQHALNMAEESLRLKSEFLASMSHEIRTPMNGVLGMLGLLGQSDLSKQQMHQVELASSSAHSLLSLINDILDFSKIEAGKLDIEVIEFDLRNKLGVFAESMAMKSQEKGLELVLDVTEVKWSMVKGDPNRIRQVLSNLVDNAIKFTSEGEILIKAALIEEEERLRFTCKITDTGIGIPADKIEGLFDSFTQVDASTTRKYGGTGLGLAIVKQLCELMEGSISVQSDPNEGSCFTVNIMLDKSELSTLVVPEVDINNVNILIVDDNETNLEVLKGQLEIWGANVTETHNAVEALQEVNNQPRDFFAVAILDMQMPEMNGADLGKLLRENTHTNKTKLIMMTSMTEKGDEAYFGNLGFSAYFSKPATTSDLFDALSIVIDEHQSDKSSSLIITTNQLKKVSDESNQRFLPKNSRILLVEDNRINQAVVLGLLSNMYLSADIANNGQEALTLLQKNASENTYDIILMDCQMPVLDGYETTKAIRNGDVGEIYKHIPIIAMTANAMKGDKEKCLAAGMSDYTAKPVDDAILKAKLCHWLGVSDETNLNEENLADHTRSVINANNEQNVNVLKEEPDISTRNANGSSDEVASITWDITGFLKRLSQNKKLAQKLIDLYLEDSPDLVQKLIHAIDNNDIDEVIQYSHKLKGSTRNLSGVKLGDILEAIEYSSKIKEHNKIRTYKLELTEEFDIFINKIKNYHFD